MKSEVRFHPVGHGMFNSGKIGPFNYVYDCGSKSINSAKTAVINYVKTLPSAKLNLLIISHFDEDHISGLGQLLNSTVIDDIILPYLPPVVRLVLAAKNGNVGGWYYGFQANPIAFLGNRAKRVTFIGDGGVRDDWKQGPRDVSVSWPEDEDERDATLNTDNLPPDEELKRDIIKLEGRLPNNIFVKSHKGITTVDGKHGPFWFFRFFNYAKSLGLVQKFRQCFEQTTGVSNLYALTGKSLQKILMSPGLMKSIKGCYKSTFPTGVLFNNSSLVALHGVNLGDAKAHVRDYGNLLPQRKTIRHQRVESQIGYLLPGDIDLANKYVWASFKDFYDSYFKYVTVLALPHHGSLHNWNHGLLKLLKSNSVLCVSSKTNDKSHPSPSIVGSASQVHLVLHCNEKQPVSEYCSS